MYIYIYIHTYTYTYHMAGERAMQEARSDLALLPTVCLASRVAGRAPLPNKGFSKRRSNHSLKQAQHDKATIIL